jgi:hypothetical protein
LSFHFFLMLLFFIISFHIHDVYVFLLTPFFIVFLPFFFFFLVLTYSMLNFIFMMFN